MTWDSDALEDYLTQAITAASRPALPRLMSGPVLIHPGQAGLTIDHQLARAALDAALQARLLGEDITTVTLPARPTDIPEQQLDTSDFPNPDAVHLTFDDGPGVNTEAILDILAQYNARATFYLIGNRVGRYPEQLHRILSDGHRIGNHTWSHPYLTSLDAGGIAREINSTQDAIESITGMRPSRLRPPYGAVNPAVNAAVANLGLTMSLWTIDPQDWLTTRQASDIVDFVLDQAQPGSVILLHVNHQHTVDALPSLITGLRDMGLDVD